MKQKQFEPLVYWTSKLSHNGITSYKQFEHCGRRMHKHSLLNLVQTVIPTDTRNLNETQSRKTRSLCQKLAYYSGTRSFSSKKNRYSQLQNRISNTHCPFQCQPRTVISRIRSFFRLSQAHCKRGFCLEKGTWRNRQGPPFSYNVK